ncbi:MAG: phosphoribosylamine--glycine ligase [Melioribacteraceae bacterium]
MKVVLIGSGGREHAIALALSKSQKLSQLFILPGNPGTKQYGKNVDLTVLDYPGILEFCLKEKIDLVVIGPEQPLVDGLADLLRENGIYVFGPSKEAARIEGEKSFAKDLMRENNIPTAAYKIFQLNQKKDLLNYLLEQKYPIVIKADGIAAGKGVVIPEDLETATITVRNFFDNSIFGPAGEKVVIEEFLTGQEVSLFIITDGDEYVLLPAAQDHKRIGDGDTGKNTGGMGAYAPAPILTDEILEEVKRKIVEPTLNALKKKDAKYNGCLYCGLILTQEGTKVIEFNCRFGDPETQVVLPLLDGDLLELFYSTAVGKISQNSVAYNGGSAVCVVAASEGYPDGYEKGKVIKGIETALTHYPQSIIYHAGTKEKEGTLLTNGGRVLGVTSVIKDNDLKQCKQMAYDTLSYISFDGIYYRKDISDKAGKIK